MRAEGVARSCMDRLCLAEMRTINAVVTSAWGKSPTLRRAEQTINTGTTVAAGAAFLASFRAIRGVKATHVITSTHWQQATRVKACWYAKVTEPQILCVARLEELFHLGAISGQIN